MKRNFFEVGLEVVGRAKRHQLADEMQSGVVINLNVKIIELEKKHLELVFLSACNADSFLSGL